MKVLFVSYNGALEPVMRSQGIPYLKGLSKKGIKCFLLSFERFSNNKIQNSENICNLKQELEESGIVWIYLKYHKKPTLPATLFDIICGIVLGIYVVIFKKIDIMHCRATIPAFMGYIITRLTGRKFIFDVRGLMAEEYADGNIWKRTEFLYKTTFWIEKKMLKQADFLVVLTENIKEVLMNSSYITKMQYQKKKNIAVIPCCVDFEKFNGSRISRDILQEKYKLSEKFVFLYIGSLGTWYLLENMLDFFIEAKKIITNAHFLILANTDRDIITDLCRKKDLSVNDVTIDRVDFKDMSDYIKLGTVGLLFYRPTFSRKATSPIKFGEYLACGIPVIINYGVGDTEYVVEHNKIGAVIKEFTVEEYRKAVMSLKNLIEKDNEVKNRCYKIAKEDYSLENGIKKYELVYKKTYGIS